MSIPVSTVPAVQSYLTSAIEAAVAADADAANVLVCFGEPSRNAPAVVIEIARQVRRTAKPTTFIGGGGEDWLNESYDIDIAVSVAAETVTTDSDDLALSERAWQMVGYIEVAVRTDPSLGDLVDLAYPRATAGGEVVWAENEIGRICELTAVIHCEVLN